MIRVKYFNFQSIITLHIDKSHHVLNCYNCNNAFQISFNYINFRYLLSYFIIYFFLSYLLANFQTSIFNTWPGIQILSFSFQIHFCCQDSYIFFRIGSLIIRSSWDWVVFKPWIYIKIIGCMLLTRLFENNYFVIFILFFTVLLFTSFRS